MKRLLLLTGVLVVAGVLTVSFRSRTMVTLSGDIASHITTIEQAYDGFVQQYAFALEQEVAAQNRPAEGQEEESAEESEKEESAQVQFTPAQKEALAELHALHERLAQTDRSELQRLNTINSVQISLHEFIALFEGHSLQANPKIIALRTEIGERGEVRKLLQEYNAKAKLWNNKSEGNLGALSAAVSDLKRELYPYLRFDGQSATNQYIDLGK